MPRVVHFEIPVDDPERAIRFYEGVFGWKTQKWDGPEDYWLTSTGPDGDESCPGIDGGFMRRTDPSQGTVNTVGVPDIEAYIARVCEHGGEIVMGKGPIPGVGWFAYAKDPEGNPFGMMQPDETAK